MSGFTPVQVPQCSCRLLYHHIRDGHPWDSWFPDPRPYSQNPPRCPLQHRWRCCTVPGTGMAGARI